MSQGANALSIGSLNHAGYQSTTWAVPGKTVSPTARLIPGLERRRIAEKKPSQSIRLDASVQPAPVVLHPLAASLVPGLVRNFAPAMMAIALADLTLMSMSSLIGQELTSHAFGVRGCVLYLCAFLIFAIPEDLYSNEIRRPKEERLTLLKAFLWATALTGFALNFTAANFLGLIIWSGINLYLLLGARWLVQKKTQAGPRNVLIVGNARLGQAVADTIQSQPKLGWRVKGFLPERQLRESYDLTVLRAVARKECVDEVIIAGGEPAVITAVLEEARRDQLDVSIVPDLGNAVALDFENLAGLPIMKVHEQRASEWTLAIKRLVDIAFSSAALIVLAPLFILIALVIKLDSAGPVLYSAARAGRKGHRFTCYKFRTMVPDADAAKEALRACNERDGAFFKMADDPRITRIGRWLRRYSFDELPQLWNVLLGDMSLVGPRPHPPDDVDRYRLEDLQRLDFVPGITGLWQVTARRDPSFDRAVSLDVHYIKNWSLLLDLSIICRTAAAVLTGSGA